MTTVEQVIRRLVRRERFLERIRSAVLANFELDPDDRVPRGSVQAAAARALNLPCSNDFRTDVTQALRAIPGVHPTEVHGQRLYRGLRAKDPTPTLAQD